MAKIIVVFGVSGVGKSWMIARLAKRICVAHIQGSQLVRDARAALSGTNVTSEDLRKGAVLDNQALLIDAFSKVVAKETLPIIFDGHCLIDAGDKLIDIPLDVVEALTPSGIVLVQAPPFEIVARRQADTLRQRPTRSEEDLAQHQEQCIVLCTDYANKLNVKLAIVPAGNEEIFSHVVKDIVNIPRQSRGL